MHRSPPLCRPVARTHSPSAASTPPTPSDLDFRAACGMLSPVPYENRPIQTPAFFTPANACAHMTPPSHLRRESLDVPPSGALVRICKGSGVTVYKMERSPDRCGAPRSPWVIKKADISPLIAHELRRVERTLEHESRLLSRISHPNIVGFRAAQRAPDGQLCLALEACDCSLYSLIQERQFARIHIGEDDRCSPLFSSDEVLSVAYGVACALSHLHSEHKMLHGDIKASNILLSLHSSTPNHTHFRTPCGLPAGAVKLCDFGVSLPLIDDLSGIAEPERNIYQGTELWRPPEARACRGTGVDPLANRDSGAGAAHCRICDRSDIYSLGLVIWEMLTGDVPYAGIRLPRDSAAGLSPLEMRPPLAFRGTPLADLHPEYQRCIEIFEWCTAWQTDDRPSAANLEERLRRAVESGSLAQSV